MLDTSQPQRVFAATLHAMMIEEHPQITFEEVCELIDLEIQNGTIDKLREAMEEAARRSEPPAKTNPPVGVAAA